MPTIIAPLQNSILNDANITEIIVEDTTVFSHYEASIYINSVLFDVVVMPKISSQKMVLTFENLLLKYISIPHVNNSVDFQDFTLILDLKLEIKRFDLGNIGVLQYTLNYYLKYSVLPTLEKYEINDLAFIAVDADVLLVQPNTKIQLPIYVNSSDTITIVQAITEEGTILSSNTGYGLLNKKLLLVSLEVNAPKHINSYFFKITNGGNSIQKKIRVIHNSYYEAKRIRIYNRFGMPMLLELFGKLSSKEDQTLFNYQDDMGIYKTAEIQTDTQVSIDTGYLLNSEKAIVSQIASSLRVEIDVNGEFQPCVVTSKSIPVINENDFINSTVLTFEYNKSPKIKN